MTKPKNQFEYCYRVFACSELTNREKVLAALLGLRARSDSQTVYRGVETMAVDVAASRQNIYGWRRTLEVKGWLEKLPKTRGRTSIYRLTVPACGCKGCLDWLARDDLRPNGRSSHNDKRV
jgi:hypothetical protein